jgi:hypothetical protein
VIEEGRKKPRNSRYEKKSLKTTKKLKKRLQIFLYLVTVPYPRRLPWCLRDKKTSRIYTKKEHFFLFQVLYYSPPKQNEKKLQMTPQC